MEGADDERAIRWDTSVGTWIQRETTLTAQRSSTLVVADEETPSTTHGVERFDSRWFERALESGKNARPLAWKHCRLAKPH